MKVTLERLSPLASISRHERVFGVAVDVIDTKTADAQSNRRRRESLVLHRGDTDPLQRMINCVEPGSYLRPHRHVRPPKAETIVLLRGAMGFIPFLDDGTPDRENFVLLHPSRGALVVDCREAIWHTFVALEPGTAVFEAKNGPYDPSTDKEFAPW